MLDTTSVKSPYIHFKRQYHEFILYYILSGDLFLTEAHIPYHLTTNDFLLLDPARVHFGTQPSSCQFFYVHFSLPTLLETTLTEERLKVLLKKKQLTESPQQPLSSVYIPKYHTIHTPSNLTHLHHLMEQMLSSFTSHDLYDAQINACLLTQLLVILSRDFSHELLYGTAQSATHSSQTIPQLLNFLNQSYALPLSSDMIESRYNCNFDHLNRQFKKLTGQTIFVYLTSLRIEKAKQLLSIGLYTIADVANRTGFHDVYYFSRVFKKYTGVSPGKYRT